MEVLLRLKHWQIFMLTFGILAIFPALQFIILFSDVAVFGGMINGLLMDRVTALAGVATAVVQACYIYIVGIRLSEKRPNDNFNENRFKICLYLMTGIAALQNVIFPLIGFDARGMNLFLSIVTLGAGLYTDYFVAKALKSVEMDRESNFDDFTGDFFSFVFFPIGVWWLQPRINNIFDKESTPFDPDAPLDQHVTM
jgi:hypothetical protein